MAVSAAFAPLGEAVFTEHNFSRRVPIYVVVKFCGAYRRRTIFAEELCGRVVCHDIVLKYKGVGHISAKPHLEVPRFAENIVADFAVFAVVHIISAFLGVAHKIAAYDKPGASLVVVYAPAAVLMAIDVVYEVV